MRWIATFAAAVVVVTSMSLDVVAAPIPTKPVYTNKTRFRIPYRYDAAEMRRLKAVGIRLYVSTDLGINWQNAQSAKPQSTDASKYTGTLTGKFDFLAPNDGEYWFAVRTLDGRGNLHPPNYEAGLKVIVDTQAPQFDIRLSQLTPGKVQLSWTANDANIDPSQLKLEFTQDGQPEWQKVFVNANASGQTSWSVPKGGTVAVRGSIADWARNTAQAQTQTQIQSATQSIPKPVRPDFSEPIADNTSTIPGPSNLNVTLPSNTGSGQNFSRASQESDLPNTSNGNTVNDIEFSRMPVAQDTQDFSFAGNAGFDNNSTGSDPFFTGNSNNSLSRNDFQGFEETRPKRSRARVVNSKKFNIEYRIDQVGPSGVSKVELFITQNNGEKWWRYGEDEDRRSPFNVAVREDGVYGFTLRVRSGVGLADDPPRPGQAPEIAIAVDQTAPNVELLPLQQGRGLSINKVLIRWKVSDENLGDRPIALSYSGSASGPWETIGGWQPDTGRYIWTLGNNVPPRLYVRIIARDAAGNLSTAYTRQPVLVDLAKPSARIVDVESGSASR